MMFKACASFFFFFQEAKVNDMNFNPSNDRLDNLTTMRIWLIEFGFMPLSTVFQSYRNDSSHYSCLSWVSPVPGWGSEVSFPRTLPRKNPEDPVRLKPRTPGLRVKHFTTEPRRSPTTMRTRRTTKIQ